jgi:flavin-dependent dehydrogenase
MEVTPKPSGSKTWPVAALYDLTVVGGGPAGTSAAITAARPGAKVLLLERGRLPRQRVCGEFVSAEALELLAGLLAETRPELLAGSARISVGRLFVDGRTITTPVDPPAASIARFDLDAALWEAALKSGVSGRPQATVEGVGRHEGKFVVKTSVGIFQSRALILAAGRWSNLGSQARVDEHSHQQWLGIKAHFVEESPAESVDLYFFEGGYCGVQPVRLAGGDGARRVNACAMVQADMARTLPEVFRLHPELEERARHWKPMMESVTTFPLVFREPCPVEDRVLRVGDAAGFVDPFVGDGISLALRSGALAAECLAPFFRSENSLEEAAAKYGQQYSTGLLPVFRSSSKIRRLLDLPGPIRRAASHLLEKAPAVSRLLVTLTR